MRAMAIRMNVVRRLLVARMGQQVVQTLTHQRHAAIGEREHQGQISAGTKGHCFASGKNSEGGYGRGATATGVGIGRL